MENNLSSNAGPPERPPVLFPYEFPPNQNGSAGSPRQQQQQQQQSHAQQQTQQPRPQTLTPTRESPANGSMAMQTLVLTVNKDATGYGMKVSGDKPVFVESVKPGGAARRAGLMPDDMILKVNGTSVRALTHTSVVDLIKATDVVELTVQRGSNRMQRPSPSTNSIAPMTPVAQRNSITAPQPVDCVKQREMEVHKMNTLQLMLDQVKKNRDNLIASNKPRVEVARADATIQKLEKELQQMVGEPGSYPAFSPSSLSSSPLFPQPQLPNSGTTTSTTPAFLSRFPRSLSSLSLGTKKKSVDSKEISSPTAATLFGSPECLSPTDGPFGSGLTTSGSSGGTPTKTKKYSASSAADHHHHHHLHGNHHAHHMNRSGHFGGSGKHQQQNSSDIPPPLPQRNNIPKKSEDTVDMMLVGSRRNILVSDLDHQLVAQDTTSLHSAGSSGSASSKASGGGKSSRGKKKNGGSTQSNNNQKNNNANNNIAKESPPLGDGNVATATSTTELQAEPPPLPPRQPGMLEVVNQNLIMNSDNNAGSNCTNSTAGAGTPNGNNNGNSVGGHRGSIELRPPPNSINTLMNYPLITTCTPVRDNMTAAFPLSYRPNIVHQMQQHQQTTAMNQSAAAAAGVNQSINKKHRRIVSSPENIGSKDFGMVGDHHHHGYRHHKTSSDSWDKRSEITPPGTPPPPYLSTSMTGSGSPGGGGHHHQHPHHQHGGHLHHHEHTTAGDLAIANPLSSINNNHHSTGNNGTTTATNPAGNNNFNNINNNNNNGGNHMAASYHGHHHGQSPVGGTNAGTGGTVPGSIVAAQANVAQKPIISMEDDDISDQESFIEENSPFRSLTQLLEAEKSVYLAVFLNFVLTNSDPAALLFYLITMLYKEGSVKDMRKWAYEIHSTFLVPGAPLLCANVDEALARDIDDVLQKENDKAEILRMVFWRSRLKAKETINQQLQQFQTKRTAGLGTMYGPNDQQLQMAKGDKVKEQRIIDETLLPKLQQYLDDLERESPKEDPKKSALCSALSTVLMRFFVTRCNPGGPIDKVHHFVSREKSFKSRLMTKNRKQTILGHNLHLQPYYEVTRCNHCQNILWGVSPQGYHCTNCELNIHRACAKDLTECCPGPAIQKNDSKITKLMEKISSRNHHQDKSRRHDDDATADDTTISERGTNTSLARQPSDRRQDLSGQLANTSGTSDHLNSSSSDAYGYKQSADDDQFRENVKSKSAPVSVNRSESYKERSQKKTRTTRRKTSDPSLTKTADEQNEASSLANNNYSSSSTSSLPLALDSRSTSLEAVSGGTGATTAVSSAGPAGTVSGINPTHSPGGVLPASASTVSGTSVVHSVGSGSGSGPGGLNVPTAREWIDSEDEGTVEPEADWSSNIPPEILSAICDLEKKRQEVINEIYQTERNHVRTLRLLEGIFMRPLQESGALPHELLNLLFPHSLINLKDLHTAFELKLKQRRSEHGNVVREIGDLLLTMFDGQTGEELKEHAAHFCARQQIALEALKERRKKDEQLQRLLTKAESHKACRRLQLKDLLPTALQRLTKYPLLFDNLYNFTVRSSPKNESEALAIRKSHESAKRILDHVNQAVRTEEDMHKLLTIQRKLDKSGLDKDASIEFRNIDLTVRKLIHDGPLTMKKNPGVQLHGLLFEDIMVLLQKQDDKYLVKYHSSPGLGGSESKYAEGRFNPITKIHLILVRQSAVDKNTFFLINTNVSQMLELTAPSSTECKTWFKHISDAADAYKARTKGTHEYGDESAGGAGHPPKDSFETVTETQKIEQTSTPIERLERKDTQCRAVSSSAGVHQQQPSAGTTGSAGSAAHGGSGTIGSGHHTHPGTIGTGGRSTDESRLSSGPGSGAAGASANETEDNLENEEKEKYKRTQRHDSQECNGGAASDDDGEPDDDQYPRGQPGGGRGSNNTRTITQQCSLVAPSEIHVSVSATLTAEPILTPAEQLRRYDQLIQKTLASKQRVVCDMFKVPDEHFQAIADIAAQPEAPKEPTDIVLAAFAYGQTLMEILSECMRVTESQQISAVSTSICDECSVRGHTKNHIPSINNTAAKESIEPTVPTIGGGGGGPPVPSAAGGTQSVVPSGTVTTASNSQQTPLQPIGVVSQDPTVNITEDEDGYCEIDEVRAAAVLLAENEKARKLTEASKLAAAAAAGSTGLDTLDDGVVGDVGRAPKSPDSHIEINENYDSTMSPSMTQKYSGNLGGELCGKNRLLHASTQAPTVPCHLIANYVTGLNAQISQLLHKINEKDIEREHLRRENQHLRELLNAMHQERVLESQETNQDQQQLATGDEQPASASFSTLGSEANQPQQQQHQQTPPLPEDVTTGATGSSAPTVPTD
uniref:Guanine nucleotide exchange factor n=1 Tax=Anopheles funestus TaxID=62324 RepID=A0A182REK6_ANOFN